MKRKIVFGIALCALLIAKAADNGSVTLPDGGKVSVEWYADNIVRVLKGEASRPSLAVTAKPVEVKVAAKESQNALELRSKALSVTIDKQSGEVSFRTPKGEILVTESAGSAAKATQSWKLSPEECIYGLGILQNGKMSQRGENRDLRPNNTEDGIPFFQSDKGYGIYWDNYSTTNISDKDNVLTLKGETGECVDYYFMYGGSADGVVSCVRTLTGRVPMAPLWAYGFMQSKERYKSQDETLDVLHRYRNDGVPIDVMIQDWQYWGNNYLWNAMEFMSESFPNPQAMLDDIHGHNAKCMISIWSSFGPKTKPYKELDEKGLLFDMATWPQSGISHIWPPRMDYPSGVRVYDCYSQEARDIYWNNLKRIWTLGMDGWWMDSTEPDHFDWKDEDFDHLTAMGPYRDVLAAYPLMTVEGVYSHQRAEVAPLNPPLRGEKEALEGVNAPSPKGESRGGASARVFILTRSCTFGQQRTGANTWSGDVVSTWDMLRKQIPAGLNFSLTGNPNFNSDLGGFFAGSYNGSWKGLPAYKNPAYHELYVRWTQHGVLTPMMRSHGADVPRELFYYGKAGEPVYDALVGAIKLRYRLLPYIYSTAWQVSKNNSTFMRALVMDFPKDAKAKSLNNEYMFGHQLLATPVVTASYTPEVIRRDKDANAGWDKNTGKTTINNLDNVDFTKPAEHTAYLPSGSKWYYFHNGKQYEGGQDVTLTLPLGEVPMFVKAGSIMPVGPDVQYSTEKAWDDLEIRLYPGADGKFVLYEDDGDTYNYENGAYTETEFQWSDRSRRLTILNRRGKYDGMIENRTFRIVLPDGKQQTVQYNGKKTTVTL